MINEMELRKKYNQIIKIEYSIFCNMFTYQETNYIDNIYKYDNGTNRHILYNGITIPYVRIFENPIYTDIIIHENYDNLKYKHFYYSFDPKKDKYISFRDHKIKIQPNVLDLDKKIFYIESYLESINASRISIFIENKLNKNRIGEIFLDYEKGNITILEFPDNKVYRYTKNSSYESSFYINKDIAKHNDMIDKKYKIDEFGIIKGDHYYHSTKYNFIETIYKYNIPVSVYENKYEDMYMFILAAYDLQTKKITHVEKILYGK